MARGAPRKYKSVKAMQDAIDAYFKACEGQPLFDKDGNPTGEPVNVNAVSAVFPYYNGATGLFGLITYRSVTAVAEVNNLGYITQNLAWDGKTFSPVFTNFAISI